MARNHNLKNAIKKAFGDNKIKGFLTNIYAILLINVILFFIIRPTFLSIFRIRREAKNYETVLKQLQAKRTKLEEFADEMQLREDQLYRYSFVFPEDYNFSYLLVVLQAIADSVGVQLVSVSYNPTSSVRLQRLYASRNITTLDPVIFNVSFTGDFYNMVQYVRELENTSFVPQVLNFEYNVKEVEGRQERTYTITFVVYRSKISLVPDPYEGL